MIVQIVRATHGFAGGSQLEGTAPGTFAPQADAPAAAKQTTWGRLKTIYR